MKLYEIINPSDAMTMYAPTPVLAGVAVALMGNGKLGVEGSPILFGWDEWLKENGIEDLSAWVKDHAAEVGTALRSVALGSVNDRRDYDAALAAIDCPEKRAAFIVARNDRRRSSMSDWETWAHQLADRINPPTT